MVKNQAFAPVSKKCTRKFVAKLKLIRKLEDLGVIPESDHGQFLRDVFNFPYRSAKRQED